MILYLNFMLSPDLFIKMELLSKEDLYAICKKYNINTKIYSYNKNNDVITTKNECCKYDLVKLLKNFFINKNNNDYIIYHDFISSMNKFNESSYITFKNVKKIKSTIKKFYQKNFDLNFDYDKLSYNILSEKWANGEPITVKEFAVEHYNSLTNFKNKHKPNVNPNTTYENIKKSIISNINEYMLLKYD